MHIKGDGSEIADHDLVHSRDDEEEPGAHSTALLHATQTENHGALVFLEKEGHFLEKEGHSIDHGKKS